MAISKSEQHPALVSRFMETWWGRCFLSLVAWSAIGWLFSLPDQSGVHYTRRLLGSLAQWWSWGLLTPLIFWADRALPFSDKQLARRILAHLLPSAVFTALYLYVFATVSALLGLAPWSQLLNTRLLTMALKGMFLWSWLVYWLIVAVRQIYRYYEHYLSAELRLQRLEKSFVEARLNALRMQLDPHFLFNALNTISSQVERDPKLARGMIGHLGDLLRLSLESKDRNELPLAEEMAFLDHYLAIQKIRFGESLRIETNISPEVKYASVPCFFVQPLVENAIRHGISRRSSGGTVSVTAERVGTHVEIRVADDGVGLPAGWQLETCAGLGLSITRQRIAGLHPDGAGRFAVHRRSGGGTEVIISLPFSLLQEEADDRISA
jgi:LytS/YehU family sensor histidine kinase